MKILHVIPIARGISREVFTYWSPETVSLGSIVFIPLRNREVPGIVIREEDAETLRAEVRNAAFKLRKIASRASIPLFSPAFIEAAQKTGTTLASTTGAVLSGLLPAAILEALETLPTVPDRWKESSQNPKVAQSEQLIFQAQAGDRMSRYRSLIRESFARNESIYLAVPTIVDAERMTEELAKGVESHTILFHSNLTKKEVGKRLITALTNEHPVLIIATGSFICVERPDIKTIIVERENARAYKLPTRPYVDLRLFIEYYARARNVRLILSGLPLRVETLWRYEEHEFSDLMPPIFRLLQAALSVIIDMRKNHRLPGTPFRVLSEEVREMIRVSVQLGERTLLFTSRRGLAPITMCQDCGSIVRTEDGDLPMMLQQGPNGNVFVSHTTGEIRDAKEKCRVCKSWRLEALGIGIERIEEELEVILPEAHVIRVDQDAAATHRQVSEAVKLFYASPGAILLATERGLSYLNEPIEHSAVISIDSLLSLPEWKVSERTFSLLLKIREITTKSYLVQTRKTDQSIIEYALKGNVMDFLRSEIELRRLLSYPPFSVLIKLSVMGTLLRVTEEMQALLTELESFGIAPYPAPLHAGKNRFRYDALIRVGRNSWPAPEMLEKLAALPPHVAIDVNPEQLL